MKNHDKREKYESLVTTINNIFQEVIKIRKLIGPSNKQRAPTMDIGTFPYNDAIKNTAILRGNIYEMSKKNKAFYCSVEWQRSKAFD